MNIREMRIMLGDTQTEFAKRYNVPFRSIQNWETGLRNPPEYIVELLEYRVKTDLINRNTISLPKYDSHKKNLPKRSDYIGAFSWLKAVQECLGESVVFALDEALMCDGSFGGRSDEYLVWVYGDNSMLQYNGVVVLGNSIDPRYVRNKNGLLYTEFNRTIHDSFANESILDMQGITEAISYYYYSNGETFDGLFITPEYQERFKEISIDAIEYYSE